MGINLAELRDEIILQYEAIRELPRPMRNLLNQERVLALKEVIWRLEMLEEVHHADLKAGISDVKSMIGYSIPLPVINP